MHVKNTKPYIPQEDISPILNDIEDALGKGNLTFGTEAFEEEFAKYTGTKYAVAVNSGTSAIEAPLRYYNIKGKNVIVPTNTFVADAKRTTPEYPTGAVYIPTGLEATTFVIVLNTFCANAILISS